MGIPGILLNRKIPVPNLPMTVPNRRLIKPSIAGGKGIVVGLVARNLLKGLDSDLPWLIPNV
ncbi:hypothetical protein D4L85_15405 [Chryseolinea soli]|uniref:Uncharacterized protein n=1 Tax=Chryseolinea soli TaxID=2321403 RepID=A0A385SLN5_9BACT|nr:hypothetical protein D4L85_15405 [Chryseolinea soli]